MFAKQVAAFLIAAQKWSYFAIDHGWHGPSSFPVVLLYSNNLGAPLSDAVIVDANAGVFTRSFQHLDVFLDLSKWTANLTWH